MTKYDDMYVIPFYLASNLTQKSLGMRMSPQTVSFTLGILSPTGFKLKFCRMAVADKNIVFRANVSPAQSRRPPVLKR